MTEVLSDIAQRVKLAQVVDQSTITVPSSPASGDLPVIFDNINHDDTQESGTNLSKGEAATCALLGAGADAGTMDKLDDIPFFLEAFLQRYYRTKASVDGFRAKQLVQICSGDVQFEHKLRFAKLKKQEKEEFV